MLRLAIAALLAFALPAWASEERPLSGAGIARLLTDAEVIGEGTRQTFYASGRTRYNDGRESWGYWRVDGDRYCSQWPPQEGWVCYDMRSWEEGGRVWIAWIGDSGARFEGYLRR
ncbi:MAG: hypothetical protein ACE5EU_00100 [Paracoccaceae bacterium]